MSKYRIRLERNRIHNYWLYWLQPDNDRFEEQRHSRLVIARVSPSVSELSWLESISSDLISRLEGMEQHFTRKRQRAIFEQIFQNASFISSQTEKSSNPFRSFVSIEEIRPSEERQAKWAQMAMFKAVYVYLTQQQRYQMFDAEIAVVYCMWQCYNLLKELILSTMSQPPAHDILNYEFARSYMNLAELLEQDTFSYAFYMLWHYGSWEGDEKAINLSHSLIRERLRLSMVLSKGQEGQNSEVREGPIGAPFCFASRRPWIWTLKKIRIHPRFRDGEARVTIRRLVRYWLLHRYDLGAAYRLAFGMTQRPDWLRTIGAVASIVASILVFFVFYFLTGNSCFADRVFASFLQGLLPCVVVLALFSLDWHCFFELLLPRLCAGISMGYLAFFISQEGWILTSLFCRRYGWQDFYKFHLTSLPFVLFFAFSISLVFLYFFKEASVYTNDRWKAIWRAFVVLGWGIVVSLSLGVWVCQLGGPILRSIDSTVIFVDNLPGLLNPIPTPALLTFAPLALVVGIIVQIIWEEKPITATVWVPEER